MFSHRIASVTKTVGTRLYHPAAPLANATPVSQQVSESLGLPVKSVSLLEHALDHHVPKLGFSETAILNTLSDYGYSSAAKSVFPGSTGTSIVGGRANGGSGALDLVLVHLARSRVLAAQQTESLMAESSKPMPLADLFANRLQLNAPIAHHLHSAQSILTQPASIPKSLPELQLLADNFAFYAGDRSHSFDWYAKRTTLASIFVTAELVMSTDKSPGFKDTMEFVERRLQEVGSIKYATESITEWSSFFVRSSANVFASLWSRG